MLRTRFLALILASSVLTSGCEALELLEEIFSPVDLATSPQPADGPARASLDATASASEATSRALEHVSPDNLGDDGLPADRSDLADAARSRPNDLNVMAMYVFASMAGSANDEGAIVGARFAADKMYDVLRLMYPDHTFEQQKFVFATYELMAGDRLIGAAPPGPYRDLMVARFCRVLDIVYDGNPLEGASLATVVDVTRC